MYPWNGFILNLLKILGTVQNEYQQDFQKLISSSVSRDGVHVHSQKVRT